MFNLKKLFAVVSFLACGIASATPSFVGEWHLGDGPQWSAGTQTAYSGQAAAALLFGGDASDYFISTISDQVADINHMAWMDGYGLGPGSTPFAENFSNGAFYTYGVRSAYILDNSCGNRYGNLGASCTDRYINYAFRNAAVVPEPSSIFLLALGMAAVGFSRRKKA